jgi:hypothetical protein
MEAQRPLESSVLTRATRRNITEDDILLTGAVAGVRRQAPAFIYQAHLSTFHLKAEADTILPKCFVLNKGQDYFRIRIRVFWTLSIVRNSGNKARHFGDTMIPFPRKLSFLGFKIPDDGQNPDPK